MLHPQTIAAAVLAIVAALNGSDALDAQPARRVRPPRGQQYDFWFGTSKLTELKFQKKFRLSRDAFVDLTESIRGDLGKNAAACALLRLLGAPPGLPPGSPAPGSRLFSPH